MSELTFEQMLEESLKTIHTGEVIEGTVIDVKPDEIILNIQDYWESQILPMKLSINYREIDEISNLIDTIQTANESNDSSKLAINIELLKNAIEKIVQLEKISIHNISKNDSHRRVILVFPYPVSIKK